MKNVTTYGALYYEDISTGQRYTPDELKDFLGIHVMGDTEEYDQADGVGLDEGTLYKVIPSRKLNALAVEGVDYTFERAKEEQIGGKPLYLQVGANAGENMKITINAMNTAILGISDVGVENHNIAPPPNR